MTATPFRWQMAPPRWLTMLFLAPGVIYGALNLNAQSAARYLGIAALVGALLVLMKRPGKYWALVMHMLIWVVLLAPLAGVTAFQLWEPLSGGVVILMAIAGGALAVRIAAPWGAERYARRGLREWEWVYTGPEFARSHRLYRRGPGVWLSALVLLAAGGALLLVPEPGWYDYLLHGFFLFVLIPLLALHPAAYPLMLISIALLVLAPISAVVPDVLPYPAPGVALVFHFLLVPLAFYWADGVGPNLIYRHRFERLVPQQEEP